MENGDETFASPTAAAAEFKFDFGQGLTNGMGFNAQPAAKAYDAAEIDTLREAKRDLEEKVAAVCHENHFLSAEARRLEMVVSKAREDTAALSPIRFVSSVPDSIRFLSVWFLSFRSLVAVTTCNIQAQLTKSQVFSLEIDLYADYPAEPSHLISLISGSFFPLFGSVSFMLLFLSDFFVCVGGGCCDEDKQAPSSESIEDIAGRFEPINILPPLSNYGPSSNLFWLFLFLCFFLPYALEDLFG